MHAQPRSRRTNAKFESFLPFFSRRAILPELRSILPPQEQSSLPHAVPQRRKTPPVRRVRQELLRRERVKGKHSPDSSSEQLITSYANPRKSDLTGPQAPAQRHQAVQVRGLRPSLSPVGRPQVPLDLAALGAAAVPVRVLRQGLRPQVLADRAPAHTHRRKELPLRVLQQDVPGQQLSAEPPEDTHGREAAPVRRVRQAVPRAQRHEAAHADAHALGQPGSGQEGAGQRQR